eukprot:gene3251-4042_t
MDADTSPSQQPAQPRGGTVEPANRAAVAKDRFQTPREAPRERFELHDPFAEVTYRANSLAEMTSKAEQLGSTRFTAISEDGKRTPITKTGGQWQRGEQLPPSPERPLDPGPSKGDASEPAKPGSKASSKLEQTDVKVLTDIEGK